MVKGRGKTAKKETKKAGISSLDSSERNGFCHMDIPRPNCVIAPQYSHQYLRAGTYRMSADQLPALMQPLLIASDCETDQSFVKFMEYYNVSGLKYLIAMQRYDDTLNLLGKGENITNKIICYCAHALSVPMSFHRIVYVFYILYSALATHLKPVIVDDVMALNKVATCQEEDNNGVHLVAGNIHDDIFIPPVLDVKYVSGKSFPIIPVTAYAEGTWLSMMAIADRVSASVDSLLVSKHGSFFYHTHRQEIRSGLSQIVSPWLDLASIFDTIRPFLSIAAASSNSDTTFDAMIKPYSSEHYIFSSYSLPMMPIYLDMTKEGNSPTFWRAGMEQMQVKQTKHTTEAVMTSLHTLTKNVMNQMIHAAAFHGTTDPFAVAKPIIARPLSGVTEIKYAHLRKHPSNVPSILHHMFFDSLLLAPHTTVLRKKQYLVGFTLLCTFDDMASVHELYAYYTPLLNLLRLTSMEPSINHVKYITTSMMLGFTNPPAGFTPRASSTDTSHYGMSKNAVVAQLPTFSMKETLRLVEILYKLYFPTEAPGFQKKKIKVLTPPEAKVMPLSFTLSSIKPAEFLSLCSYPQVRLQCVDDKGDADYQNLLRTEDLKCHFTEQSSETKMPDASDVADSLIPSHPGLSGGVQTDLVQNIYDAGFLLQGYAHSNPIFHSTEDSEDLSTTEMKMVMAHHSNFLQPGWVSFIKPASLLDLGGVIEQTKHSLVVKHVDSVVTSMVGEDVEEDDSLVMFDLSLENQMQKSMKEVPLHASNTFQHITHASADHMLPGKDIFVNQGMYMDQFPLHMDFSLPALLALDNPLELAQGEYSQCLRDLGMLRELEDSHEDIPLLEIEDLDGQFEESALPIAVHRCLETYYERTNMHLEKATVFSPAIASVTAYASSNPFLPSRTTTTATILNLNNSYLEELHGMKNNVQGNTILACVDSMILNHHPQQNVLVDLQTNPISKYFPNIYQPIQMHHITHVATQYANVIKPVVPSGVIAHNIRSYLDTSLSMSLVQEIVRSCSNSIVLSNLATEILSRASLATTSLVSTTEYKPLHNFNSFKPVLYDTDEPKQVSKVDRTGRNMRLYEKTKKRHSSHSLLTAEVFVQEASLDTLETSLNRVPYPSSDMTVHMLLTETHPTVSRRVFNSYPLRRCTAYTLKTGYTGVVPTLTKVVISPKSQDPRYQGAYIHCLDITDKPLRHLSTYMRRFVDNYQAGTERITDFFLTNIDGFLVSMGHDLPFHQDKSAQREIQYIYFHRKSTYTQFPVAQIGVALSPLLPCYNRGNVVRMFPPNFDEEYKDLNTDIRNIGFYQFRYPDIATLARVKGRKAFGMMSEAIVPEIVDDSVLLELMQRDPTARATVNHQFGSRAVGTRHVVLTTEKVVSAMLKRAAEAEVVEVVKTEKPGKSALGKKRRRTELEETSQPAADSSDASQLEPSGDFGMTSGKPSFLRQAASDADDDASDYLDEIKRKKRVKTESKKATTAKKTKVAKVPVKETKATKTATKTTKSTTADATPLDDVDASIMSIMTSMSAMIPDSEAAQNAMNIVSGATKRSRRKVTPILAPSDQIEDESEDEKPVVQRKAKTQKAPKQPKTKTPSTRKVTKPTKAEYLEADADLQGEDHMLISGLADFMKDAEDLLND